jgi:predicted esterase
VPGYGDAVVVAPAGVTAPAPVLVAVLGIGDTPESQCATWRELVGQRAFVLCPRGLPHYVREEPASPIEPAEGAETEGATAQTDEIVAEPAPDSGKVVQVGFYPPDLSALEREVDAGLEALRARFGKYVAAGPVVYSGFSRGAFLGASLVAKKPQTHSRAILIEGGQSAWTDEAAAAFAKNGGKRILFACGRPSCVGESEAAAAVLAKQHVETRIVHGQGEGHGYKKQVKDQIRESFDWVTEGEPLWRQMFASLPKHAD